MKPLPRMARRLPSLRLVTLRLGGMVCSTSAVANTGMIAGKIIPNEMKLRVLPDGGAAHGQCTQTGASIVKIFQRLVALHAVGPPRRGLCCSNGGHGTRRPTVLKGAGLHI